MNRISTSDTYSSALLGIMQAQQQQQQAAQQVSSGKLASDLKGYAADAQTLTAAQTVKSRIDTYLDTNTRVADRLSAQDTALTAVSDAASGARKAVMDALASGDGSTVMQALQGWYAQAAEALNTDYQGSYLFGGGQTGAAPVDSSTLDGLATGTVASHFKNGTLTTTDRLTDTETMTSSFTASDVGTSLFTSLQNIAKQNALTPFGATMTQAQIDFLQSQVQPLTDASSEVDGKAAQNGVFQSRVDTVKSVLTDNQTTAQNILSGITDADPARAATNLQLAQVALQASAQVWQTLSSSSLLNVLTASA